MGGFDASHDTAACSAPCRSARRDLRSARAGWSFDSRRVFARSVSAEEGVVVEAAVESSRKAFGSDADSGAFVVDARAFQRVFSRHTVLALRLAGAGSTGDAAGQRVFSAAGSGAPSPSFDFGRDTIGLLRGFDPEDVIGTRAAVANVDLRVPLLRVQRGAGTLPIFLRSVHAAAFLDAGSAWQGRFRAADVRYAAGGELSLDAVGLYSLRFTLAGGVAWTHDPVAARDRVVPFARIGYAF
jgi:hemolysin activation/secretion protein